MLAPCIKPRQISKNVEPIAKNYPSANKIPSSSTKPFDAYILYLIQHIAKSISKLVIKKLKM